jgi:hypothetical protein
MNGQDGFDTVPEGGAEAMAVPVNAPAADPGLLLMAWLVPLVFVGYPLAGASTIFFPFLDPTFITYGYRAIVAALAAVAIVGALVRNRTPVFPLALTLLLVAYLIRLYVDNYLVGVYRADLAMLFYVGGVLPPVLAVFFAGRPLQETQLIVPTFVVALAASSLLFVIGALGLESQIISSLEQTGGRLTLDTVNPITIGHVGATLLITCVAAWYQPGRPIPRLVIAAAAVIAVATMLEAGSRGPFVAIGFCLITYSVVARRWGAAALALIAVIVVASRSSPDQIVILDRFSTTGWDAASEARLLTQDYAIADFIDHPFVGHAYLEAATLDYPHNLIIDAAMALGLAGLIPLGVAIIQAAREVVRRLRTGHLLAALITVQFFIAAQFSGSIWGHSNLFTMMALLLVWKGSKTEPRAAEGKPVQATAR